MFALSLFLCTHGVIDESNKKQADSCSVDRKVSWHSEPACLQGVCQVDVTTACGFEVSFL